MHCAACWEHLEQEEDLQDKIVSRVHRGWGILQERIVAPTSEEKLAVTGKSSVGRYPCPTGVQPQGDMWSSTKRLRVELLWLTSSHASQIYPACMRAHTHVSICHTSLELASPS